MKPDNRPEPQDSLIAALERTDFSDESRIRRSLRGALVARLGSREAYSMETIVMRRSTLIIRVVLIPASVLLIALVGILAIPSARAAAEEIIARFGKLLISSAPTGAEQIVASPQSDVNLGGVSAPTPNFTNWNYVMSQDEADSYLGTSLLVPAYVPEGYSLTLRYPASPSGDSRGISATYNTADAAHALIVEQYRFGDINSHEMGLGAVPVTRLTVRGVDALWAEQVPLGWINNALIYDPQTGGARSAPGATGPQPIAWKLNLLVWEEDGSVFRVMSDTLPKDELVRVAESLPPSSTGEPMPTPETPTAETTQTATQIPSETPTAETTQPVTETPTSDTGSIPPTGEIEPSPTP